MKAGERRVGPAWPEPTPAAYVPGRASIPRPLDPKVLAMRNPITRPLPAVVDLSGPSVLGGAVTTVVDWARATPPDGRRRVIAVEGRSGAGKTTLAGGVAERLGAPLIHMDDLYAGWDGLRQGVDALLTWVLEPLAEGRPAVWRRFDWAAGAYAEEHPVPDGDWLVVEGVGAGGRVLRPYLRGVVWVDAPAAERKRRALARDGETYAPHWDRWARQEDAFYADDQVRENADLIIENPGAGPRSSRGR